MLLTVFLGSLLALVVFAGLGVLLLLSSRIGAITSQVPARAVPKPVLDCGIPGDPPTIGAINAAVTGGVHHAVRIVVPQGMVLKLTSRLILVADDHLQVDGTITMDAAATAAGTVVSIVLACRNGPVLIGPTGQVGQCNLAAPAGASQNVAGSAAVATGAAGTQGGFVKLTAPSGTIAVFGNVEGFAGGLGGTASATGVQAVVATPRGAVVLPFGGAATAVAAQGGSGGDVILCALDGINIAGSVRAGHGGSGGVAVAAASAGQPAAATAGPGNDGGTVTIQGLAPGMAVAIVGRVIAGSGGEGGAASGAASGSPTLGAGSDGRARAGDGGNGGTVTFVNCVVQPIGIVESFDGGRGGDAGASGANGTSVLAWGTAGGDAIARGGDGGRPGAIPSIPQPVGPAVAGRLNSGGAANGAGGNAAAQPGSGGSGRFGGGASGTGTATGGSGKSGPATPATTGPVAAAGAVGGAAPQATSPGAP